MTLKSDCPVQENDEIFKDFNTDCWFTSLLVLLFNLEILKKKKLCVFHLTLKFCLM